MKSNLPCFITLTFILLMMQPDYLNGQINPIIPNPLISGNKLLLTSSGQAPFLNDGSFKSKSFKITDNSWVALQIGKGPSSILFSWNSPAYSWIQAPAKCIQPLEIPEEYVLEVSKNSTNGRDGDWKTELRVENNWATARIHRVNFKNAVWIRMKILHGKGTLDEIEVFDDTNHGSDTWLFAGTSITANAFKASPPDTTFGMNIHNSARAYHPAMIRGGVPCITSGDLVLQLSQYITFGGNLQHWALEMGTNDGWKNGDTNVVSFKKNLQVIIDTCHSHGIEVILSKPLATNAKAAGWQLDKGYLQVVDELTRKNKLYSGPDFYSWFLAHPDDLSTDGVHPNEKGAASIQRLWAESLRQIYDTESTSKK